MTISYQQLKSYSPLFSLLIKFGITLIPTLDAMRYSVFSLVLFFTLLMQDCLSQDLNYSVSEFNDTIPFSLDKYSNIEPVRNEPNKVVEGWENYYFSRSDCRCLFDGEYFIGVKDIMPGVENLMITLQGGGAS